MLPLLAAQFVGTAAAQAPSKIGIINIQAAIVSTDDGKKALGDLESRFGPRRKELEKKQQDIQQLQAQLQKGGTVLGDDQKRKLMGDIDAKTKSFNREVEDAQAEVEQEQGKIYQQLGQKMMGVIDKYARDKGFAVILDVSTQQTPVLYAANDVDVTKEIIELYNKSTGAAAAPAAAAPAAPAPAAPAPKKK
ncbi:MAG: OmpH family outer membrane protein [Bryobacteraceae bacterium]|nr:OmpH family outer membrane protein [Bryobacteraceae bacterium]